MRMNLPVTEHERTFSSDQRLIYTTDLNSRITYCNEAFVAISGFTYDELVGQPHKLVRHPDMPPSVFGHMWETIKHGKPWMGVVKNRAKNGDYYWFSAYVTAIYEQGRISGYESVRSVPTREQIRRAGLGLEKSVEFGQSYAITLKRWHETFNDKWDDVAGLGFDQRFRNMWNFYLTSCASAFASGNCDLTQITMTKPE